MTSLIKLQLILFCLLRLVLLNNLKVNARSLLGLGPTITEITGKFIETIQRKKI